MLRQLVFVAFLVGAALAGPTPKWFPSRNEERCSLVCSSGSRNLNYEPGKTYVYSYRGKTTFPSRHTQTKVDLEAKVHISAYQHCELAMQFHEVQLHGLDSEDDSRFQKAVEAEPVIVHFEDGQIMGICPGKNQPEWVTNIARGFLSAFQTHVSPTEGGLEKYEIDVMGKCYTAYSTSKSRWSGTTIKKEKDMHTCTDSYRTDLPAVQIPLQEYQSKYPFLIRSNFTCEQTLKDNVLDKIYCQDSHHLPLQHSSNGIQTTVDIKLDKILKDLTVKKGRTKPKTSLLFVPDFNATASTVREVKEILKELCVQTRDGVERQAPEVFGELTEALSTLSKHDLRSLYQSIENNQICDVPSFKDLFLDAVASCDSGEAYSFLAYMIDRKEDKDDLQANMWYLMMSVAKNTSEEAIEAFVPTLKRTNSRHALLGISSMIAGFCHNTRDCLQRKSVKSAIRALAGRLNSNCGTSSEEEEKLHLLLLKALGNIGFTDPTTEKVMECFKEKEASESVRIAAIDALRHVPCQPQTWERALDILSRETETPVIRVAAFLHLMRCPSEDTVKQINTIYKQVRSAHVGSFMYTFLTNLQETSDPMKQDQRSAVSDYYFEERFPGYFLNQSRNYEFSKYFADSVGFTKDINVVFPKNGVFPRHAATNLTVAALGHSMNLAEHTYYLKGAERGFVKLYRKVMDYYSKLPPEIRQYLPKDIIESLVKQVTEQISDSFEEEFDFIIGMRMFGRDISHLTANDIEELLKKIGDMDLMQILKKIAVLRDEEITRGIQFLNTQVIIPTISGMPINLKLNGTAVAGLKLKGKADVSDAKNGNVDIDFIAEPSFAAQIACHASIDTHFSKPGVKVNATVHSSVSIGGKVQIDEKGIARLALKLPKKSMKLVNVTVDAYEVDHYNQRRIGERRTPQREKCFNQLNSILGVNVCVSTQIPLPFLEMKHLLIPFNTPISFSVEINKTDVYTAGYEFIAFWTPKEVDGRKSLVLSFDTPHSHVDRHYAVALYTEKADRSGNMQILVRTPSGSLVSDITRRRYHLTGDEYFRTPVSGKISMHRQKRAYFDEGYDDRKDAGTYGAPNSSEEEQEDRETDEGSDSSEEENPSLYSDPYEESEETGIQGIGGPLIYTKVQARQGMSPISEALLRSQNGKEKSLIEREMKYLAGTYGGNLYNVSARVVLPPYNPIIELNVTANRTQVVIIGLQVEKTRNSKQHEYQTRISFGFGKQKLMQIEGGVVISQGSGDKSHIELEFYEVDQRGKPFLKGKIVKQGPWSFENYKKDFKLSSDIELKTSRVQARLTGVAIKQGGKFTFNKTLEYRLPKQGYFVLPRKYNTANLQFTVISSGSRQVTKLSADGELRLTGMERSNMKFSWNLNLKPGSSFETNLEFCSRYLCHRKHMNKISIAARLDGPAIKAQINASLPMFLVSYEITGSVERVGKGIIINARVIKNGKTVYEFRFKHLPDSLNHHYSMEAYLMYPGREIQFQIEHQRTPTGWKQIILLQWQIEKRFELQHEYSVEIPARFSFRRTYQAKVNSPFWTSQIEHKTVMETHRKNINIESYLLKDGKEIMRLEGVISIDNPIRLKLRLRDYTIEINANASGSKKYLYIDARPDSGDKPRHKLSVTLTKEHDELHFLIEYAWDADRRPDSKMQLELHTSRKPGSTSFSGTAEFSDQATLQVEFEFNEDLVHGPHKLQIALTKKGRTAEIGFSHEIRDGKVKSYLYVDDVGDEKLRLELNGKYRNSQSGWDLDGKLTFTSRLPQIEDCVMNVKLSRNTKLDVVSFNGQVSLETGSSRTHAVQLEYSYPEGYGQGQYKYHLAIQTPHEEYQSLEALVTAGLSDETVEASFELTKNSQVLVAIRIKAQRHLTKYVWELQTQSDCTQMKQISWRVEGVENKYVQCQIHVNGKRALDFKMQFYNGIPSSAELELQIEMGPKITAELQSMHEFGSQQTTYELQVMKDGNEILKIEKSFQYDEFEWRSVHCMVTVKGKRFLTADVTNDESGQEFDIKVEQIAHPLSIKGAVRRKEERAEIHICPLEGYGKCLDIEAEWDSKAGTTDVRLKAGAELDLQLHVQVKVDNDVKTVDVELSKDGKQISLHVTHKEYEYGCDIDATLVLTKHTFHVTAKERKLNDKMDSRRWTIEIVPDNDPKKKVTLLVTHSGVPCYALKCDLMVEVSLVMPGWKEPAQFGLEYSRDMRSERPVKVKVTLSFPRKSMPNLIVEVSNEYDKTKSLETTYIYRIYDSQRKLTDTSIKVTSGQSKIGTFFRIAWSYMGRNKQTKSGSVYLTMNQESRKLEFFIRMLERDIHVNAHWNDQLPKEWAVESKIRVGSWVASPSLIVQQNGSCIYLIYKNETGSELVLSYCVGLNRKDILNVTLALYGPHMRPISLAEISISQNPKGYFVFKNRVPILRIAEMLKMPDEVIQVIKETQVEEIPDDVVKMFKILKNQIDEGLRKPTQEALKELMPIIADEIVSLADELKDIANRIITACPHVEGLAEIYQKMYEVYQELKESLQALWDITFGNVLCWLDIQHIKERIEYELCGPRGCFIKVQEKYEEYVELLTDVIEALREKTSDDIKQLWLKVKKQYESLIDFCCKTIAELTWMIQEIICNKIFPMCSEILPKEIRDALFQIYEEFISALLDSLDDYLKYQAKLLKKYYDELTTSQIAQDVREAVEELVGELKKVTKEWESEGIVRVLAKWLHKALYPIEFPSVDVKSQRGEVVVLLRLPMDYNSMRQSVAYAKHLYQKNASTYVTPSKTSFSPYKSSWY